MTVIEQILINGFYFGVVGMMLIKFSIYLNALAILQSKNLTYDDMDSHIQIISIGTFITYIFTFIGFMSSQYILFIIILALSFIPSKKEWILKTKALLRFFLLGFILINKYHLRSDFQELIVRLLS